MEDFSDESFSQELVEDVALQQGDCLGMPVFPRARGWNSSSTQGPGVS